MEAFKRWRRVKLPEYITVFADTGASVGGGLAASVSISIRTDGDEDGNFESFKIVGTPDEMENLAIRMIKNAHEARRILAENKTKMIHDIPGIMPGKP